MRHDIIYLSALIQRNLFDLMDGENQQRASSISILQVVRAEEASASLGRQVRVGLLEWFRMKQTKMYVCTLEEFILVDLDTLLHKMKVMNIGKCWFIYTRNKGLRNVRIALRSQLTSES